MLAATNPAQTLSSHESFDRAPRRGSAVTTQRMPHLANPADPTAEPSAPEDPLDLGNQHLLAQRPGRGGTFFEGFVPDGAIFTPCSVSTRQTGSTPNQSR